MIGLKTEHSCLLKVLKTSVTASGLYAQGPPTNLKLVDRQSVKELMSDKDAEPCEKKKKRKKKRRESDCKRILLITF